MDGYVSSGFEPVAAAFQRNFDELGDLGAAVCIYRDGERVVDLWGGVADPKTARAYGADTLQLVFSTTKGVTALCAHMLVQDGMLDLDAPVSYYWPEFAAAGKQHVSMRWLMSHQAGLPTIDGELALDEVLRWDPVVQALAAQAPFWEPGSAHGYHALTFGWLVGEVIRRVTGSSVGAMVAERIAGPLSLDLWIGLPEEHEPRVAPLRTGPLPSFDDLDPDTLQALTTMLGSDGLALRALTLNGAFGIFGKRGGPFNSREVHAAEVPAANCITDARSLARMYAATIGTVDGVLLLAPEVLDEARREVVGGPDRVLVAPTSFGLGFMCHSAFSPLLGPGSFGHSGAGGSLGFADPDSGVAFAYVMNQMRLGLGGDERTASLVEALRASLS
jgi:CubicO group peptidase (beta-lactamase class C family)